MGAAAAAAAGDSASSVRPFIRSACPAAAAASLVCYELRDAKSMDHVSHDLISFWRHKGFLTNTYTCLHIVTDFKSEVSFYLQGCLEAAVTSKTSKVVT